MPDKILQVLDVSRSNYNVHEIVLTLECQVESYPLRYRRTITLTEALASFDPIELLTKLRKYRDKLRESLELTEGLISTLRRSK